MKLLDYVVIAAFGILGAMFTVAHVPDDWPTLHRLWAVVVYGSLGGGGFMWCLDWFVDWLVRRLAARKKRAPGDTGAEG